MCLWEEEGHTVAGAVAGTGSGEGETTGGLGSGLGLELATGVCRLGLRLGGLGCYG